MAGGQTLDITNRLEGQASYLARWLVWDDTLIAAHAQAHPHHAVIRHAMLVAKPSLEWAAAYQRAVHAMDEPAVVPLEIARHRAVELLLWLGWFGGRFEPARAVTLAAHVRHLISQDLARDWPAPAVAFALAMSEATLRRKLSSEGTTLTEILVDARMSMALNLLQSTARPIGQIAGDVGYQSPTQFAVRFRQRFGFAPRAVRASLTASHMPR